MKRDKIVPVRLTQMEYDLLAAEGEENLSAFIREKIFAEQKEKASNREILFLLRALRADLGHALKLYDAGHPEAEKEIKNCRKLLEKLEGEIGGYGIKKYEGEQDKK